MAAPSKNRFFEGASRLVKVLVEIALESLTSLSQLLLEQGFVTIEFLMGFSTEIRLPLIFTVFENPLETALYSKDNTFLLSFSCEHPLLVNSNDRIMKKYFTQLNLS